MKRFETRRPEGGFDPEASGLLLTTPAPAKVIGEEEVAKANAILQKYKSGKANLEEQIIQNERWYQLRHWDYIRKQTAGENPEPEPASAWLFNAIMNKHADAMDNYPEPNVLPRERSDEDSARQLASILPAVLERCDFEEAYDKNWWEKLKHGCGVYGVCWNPTLENGLGDIDIQPVDLLNVFWEPGVQDIQRSKNLFVAQLEDNDVLEEQYPQLKGRMGGAAIELKQYAYDDAISVEDKSLVVDWYYKRRAANGRTLVHYARFCGDTLLFASENEEKYVERGYYDHGLYPFEFDVLFPEKGSPCGFGLIALAKDPQLYIDKLSANILQSSMMKTKPRWFVSAQSGINREQLLDWGEPLVEVEGSLDENRIRPLEVGGVDGIALNVMQMKIDEMKETSANRDVSSGGSASGATAAAAIAALQEAGNKSSRDMIAASYRRYKNICYLCIELMRQFYDVSRSFRITGQTSGAYQFADFSNAGLRDQPMGTDSQGVELFRRPVFDITIKAQKKNPFSRASQNQLAKELYAAGFFDPSRAQEVLGCLEMMEFEGKDKVRSYVAQGQTLMQMVQQMSGLLQQLTGVGPAQPGHDSGAAGGVGPKAGTMEAGAAGAERTAATPYMDRLAANSKPDAQNTGRVNPG